MLEFHRFFQSDIIIFPICVAICQKLNILQFICANQTSKLTNGVFIFLLCHYSGRVTQVPRSIARTAIRRNAIGTTMNGAANNNVGVFGATTLQTQIGSFSQNGKYQLQILAQPEQQHRARYFTISYGAKQQITI